MDDERVGTEPVHVDGAGAPAPGFALDRRPGRAGGRARSCGVRRLPDAGRPARELVEQPNERSSCWGLTFSHYPPGTMDAASVVYCVGLKHPLPTG
jgi:hypothetical protein